MPFVGFETDAAQAAQALGAMMERDSRKVYVGLQAAVREMGNLAIGLYRQAVASWRHKPVFRREVELTGTFVSVAVSTDDRIFRFVDQGTRPHLIRPKPGGVLAFQAGYRAKTSVASLRSGPGGASGDWVFTRRPVRHPGIEARGFSEMVQAEVNRAGPRLIDRQLERALRG